MYKALYDHQCALDLEGDMDNEEEEELTVGADIIAVEAEAAMVSSGSGEEELTDGAEPESSGSEWFVDDRKRIVSYFGVRCGKAPVQSSGVARRVRRLV